MKRKKNQVNKREEGSWKPEVFLLNITTTSLPLLIEII